MTKPDLYKKQFEDREAYTQKIIQSTARYKIIVAGPGTGKSYTFKKLLESKDNDNLALTFINNLATDLQNELGDFAKSYTFHGYCKKLLHRISVEGIDTNFQYFPKLPLLVISDSQYLETNLDEFDEAFNNLLDDERISFFIERGDYYNSVGHYDAVYRVLRYFQHEYVTVPSFSQVVVDEYQDFNSLEVAFIDEIAESSPVLIAGDDDQAVYAFRHASPKYVREKAIHQDFVKFDLPYCSRCPQVIVDAVCDITTKAQSINKLQDRIDKPYICFLPDKETDSTNNPKIIHARCSVQTLRAPYISKFIEKEIKEIPQEEIDHARKKGYPCVLILGPKHYAKQINNYLKKSFKNIDYKENQKNEIDIVDGYKLLINNKESNLGWRIILKCTDYPMIEEAIQETHKSNAPLFNIIEETFRNDHLGIVSALEIIKAGNEVSEEIQQKVSTYCKHTKGIESLMEIFSVDDNADQIVVDQDEDTSVSIKITTLNGSKGLSANYVFIVGMNNTGGGLSGFPSNSTDPSDNEICQLIVGITRTRKKCYLISNSRFADFSRIKKSVFIDWIDPSKIDDIEVNKDYFKNI
ncbi:MAG: UvrD-helicase domain-containing protein [Thermodesulfobacteriota bacterium]